MISLIFSLLAVQCSPGPKQDPPDNPYVTGRDKSGFLPGYSVKRADLLSDIDMYTGYIGRVHPDPYRLISEEDFVSETEKIKSEIDAMDHDSIDLFECYYYLQKIAVLIRDGHTKIYRPENWEKLEASFFPLNIKIIEGRMFVGENFGENDIPLRAEILSIDNRTVDEMISDMLPYCEGTFREFRSIRLEEEFRYFIHTLYGSEAQWEIEYAFSDKRSTASIEGISRETLAERNRKSRWFSVSSVKIGDEEVPVFNMPHLGYSKKTFKPVIDKFFDDHIDKPDIIIDLRGCPGGNGLRTFDAADHLIDTSYSASKKMTFRTSKVLKDYVRYYIQDHLYKQNKPIDEWKTMLYSTGIRQDEYDDIYKIILDSDLNAYCDVGNHSHSPDSKVSKYRGRVFLLVDHRSFSAAVVFASVFRHYDLATVVGRETGGRIDLFSDAVDIELPKTGLISKVPTATLTLHGEIPDRGVIPDIEVDLGVDDFLSGNDPDIEAVMNLIRGGQ